MVLPKRLRQELAADPGEVDVRRTPDGVLITSVTPTGQLVDADDGLPLLQLGRKVTNEEVLVGIDDERAER